MGGDCGCLARAKTNAQVRSARRVSYRRRLLAWGVVLAFILVVVAAVVAAKAVAAVDPLLLPLAALTLFVVVVVVVPIVDCVVTADGCCFCCCFSWSCFRRRRWAGVKLGVAAFACCRISRCCCTGNLPGVLDSSEVHLRLINFWRTQIRFSVLLVIVVCIAYRLLLPVDGSIWTPCVTNSSLFSPDFLSV